MLYLFSACTQKRELTVVPNYINIIKKFNISLLQKDALKYFFYTQGIDKVTLEPNAEAESNYYYFLQDSQENFIDFKKLNHSNILKTTDTYLLIIFNNGTLAGTFRLDGTPINFLLLNISFGTNEFSIKRTYKRLNKNTFLISDTRFDTDWILYPTKGIDKLTLESNISIEIDKKGFFHAEKILFNIENNKYL